MSEQAQAVKVSPPFERLILQLRKDWWGQHTDRPDALYHYTDIKGLEGIVSSNQLWATDARYLNDASELAYGCELVSDALTVTRQQGQYSQAVQQFLESAATDVLFNPYEHGICVLVACFCEQEDLLSQWRAYAARGAGYSIGFHSGALSTTPEPRSISHCVR